MGSNLTSPNIFSIYFFCTKILCVEFGLMLAEGDHSHEFTAPVAYSDEQLSDLIDTSLDKMDTSRDGFIDFVEYRAAHKALNLSL